MKKILKGLICTALSLLTVISVCACGGNELPYAKTFKTETFNSISHLQGFASDGTYYYMAFTNIIAKVDKNGNTVASLLLNDDDGSGFIQSPHLGDCAYHDGKLYVSYTPKTGYTAEVTYDYSVSRIPYAFIVEVDKLTQINQAPDDSYVTCAYLGDPITTMATKKWWEDIGDTRLEGTNRPTEFDDEINKSYVKLGGEYGIMNGLDAVTVAPKIGELNDTSEYYLTYALNQLGWSKDNAKFANGFNVADRKDNDYVVIGQVPISKIEQVKVPYSQIATAPSIAVNDMELYFFYCGYHTYGGQTINYDPGTKTFILGLYDLVNSNPKESSYPYGDRVFYDGNNFPYYLSYVIDASAYTTETLIGNGSKTGKVLQAKYGKEPDQYGIYKVKGYSGKWNEDFCTYNGIVPLGDGYYYTAVDQTVYEDDIAVGHYANFYLHKFENGNYVKVK